MSNCVNSADFAFLAHGRRPKMLPLACSRLSKIMQRGTLIAVINNVSIA